MCVFFDCSWLYKLPRIRTHHIYWLFGKTIINSNITIGVHQTLMNAKWKRKRLSIYVLKYAIKLSNVLVRNENLLRQKYENQYATRQQVLYSRTQGPSHSPASKFQHIPPPSKYLVVEPSRNILLLKVWNLSLLSTFLGKASSSALSLSSLPILSEASMQIKAFGNLLRWNYSQGILNRHFFFNSTLFKT